MTKRPLGPLVCIFGALAEVFMAQSHNDFHRYAELSANPITVVATVDQIRAPSNKSLAVVYDYQGRPYHALLASAEFRSRPKAGDRFPVVISERQPGVVAKDPGFVQFRAKLTAALSFFCLSVALLSGVKLLKLRASKARPKP